MSRKLSELRTAVESYIQNVDAVVESDDIDHTLARAIRVLSQKHPYGVYEEHTGDGTTTEWVLSTSTWIPGFSKVSLVYYPWDDTDAAVPPPTLDRLTYSVYEKTAGVFYFKLRVYTPSASEKIRIHYPSRHAVTETASTIADEGMEDSAILLASAFCLRIMAARAIAKGMSNISADTSDYQSRSSQYLTIAKQYEEESGLKAYVNMVPALAARFISCGRKKRVVDTFNA